MINGSIVSLINDEEKLYIVKGFVNDTNGQKLAILEEVANISGHTKLEKSDLLQVLWAPKNLINEVKEYEIRENVKN